MDYEHGSGNFGEIRGSENSSGNDGIDSQDPDSFTLQVPEREGEGDQLDCSRSRREDKQGSQKEHRPIARDLDPSSSTV